MVIVIASPYAASIFDDSLKKITTRLHINHNDQFTKGRYTCPLIRVGWIILICGQKFREIASLIRVNDPLIRAWLAIIDAAVEMIIPGKRNQPGIIAKKGRISVPGV